MDTEKEYPGSSIYVTPLQVFNTLWKLQNYTFILYNNTRAKKMLWDFKIFDPFTENLLYFSQGPSRFSPVRMTLNYLSSLPGTGAQLIEQIFDTDLRGSGIYRLLSKINFEVNQFKHFSNLKEYDYFTSVSDFIHRTPFDLLNYFYLNSDESKIITMVDWRKSHLPFSQFSKDKVGWKIDDDIFDHFFGAVPPIATDTYFQLGEPYDFDKNGIDRFFSFIYFRNNVYFQGLKTKKDMLEWNPIQTLLELETY